MAGIVISYRRDDAQDETGHLASELRRRFDPERVFLDVAAIQPGVDFRKAIDSAVQKADLLLVVMGRSWLTIKDGRGQRRLDDPMGLVRLEVAAALERNVPVIPVLVQGAAAPSAEELPKSLEGLAWRNAVEISHARWDYDTVYDV